MISKITFELGSRVVLKKHLYLDDSAYANPSHRAGAAGLVTSIQKNRQGHLEVDVTFDRTAKDGPVIWTFTDDLDNLDEILIMDTHDCVDEENIAVIPSDVMPAHPVVDEIRADLTRPIEFEGFAPDHDDLRKHGQLALAASCYLNAPTPGPVPVPVGWPWNSGWWKPKTKRQNLLRAATLIVAEIERLDQGSQPAVLKEPVAQCAGEDHAAMPGCCPNCERRAFGAVPVEHQER